MLLNEPEQPASPRRRIGATAALIVAVFAVLLGRFWVLQIGQMESWRSLSENNRIRLERLPATRGLVLDRHGEPLVDNRPAFDVQVVPEDTTNLAATLARLDEVIDEELPDLKDLEQAARRQARHEPLLVQRDVDWDTVVRLEVLESELPGVRISTGPIRTYTHGTRASHLLGYVGQADPATLDRDRSYRMGDLVGKTGLERSFESWLRGRPGAQQTEVDALGRRLRVISEQPPQPGNNLVLTLDGRLQAFAEQLLEGREGSIVALDTRTGGVLALASAPGFDPNAFARGISSTDWKALIGNTLKPMQNRTVQGQYPPGSTFKIVTAAAALEEGIVNPFTRIHCGGSWRFGNRSYRCWKAGGHGSVDLHDALVGSCDVYFYQVGHRLGIDTIAKYARRFGLGRLPDAGLDHEKPGLVPDSAWKRSRFGEPWYPGETLSVAIGQGALLATPLQMARVIGAIASGGVLRRPRFVDHVEAANGEIVKTFEPEIEADLGFRPTTLLQLREALRDVVESPRGTGRSAHLPTVEVGGKTGTVQIFRMGQDRIKTATLPRHLRDHAWFVAFAPVEEPEIAIAVLIEHAGTGGGATAAPIARDLADFWFASTRGRDYQLAGTGGILSDNELALLGLMPTAPAARFEG